MIVLDRNWRCEAGEIDLVLRDGDVLVVCEVKTRSGVGFGTPHEAVTPTPRLDRLRAAGRALAARARRAVPATSASTWSRVLRPPPRARRGRPRRGGRLMAVRDRPHRRAPRAPSAT